jgi:hypothetical protein
VYKDLKDIADCKDIKELVNPDLEVHKVILVHKVYKEIKV